MITYERWREVYLVKYRGALYVNYNSQKLLFPHNACTASEAIGYGMLVSVLGRNQSDFDGLLAFYRMFTNRQGLMNWQLLRHRDGEIVFNPNGGESSATDGDMDAAFALFLAAAFWDEPAYHAAGIRICAALYAGCFNKTTQMSTPGDFAVPGSRFYTISRPSDYMLTHLKRFAEEDVSRGIHWAAVLESTVKTIQHQLELHSTGLMADFLQLNASTGRYVPVTGKVLERVYDKYYCWNSCRSPWRLAIYYAETGDERVLPMLKGLVTFFETQATVVAGYTLEGLPLENYTHTCFQAPVWCLFSIMNSPQVAKMEREMALTTPDVYFGDTIELLCRMQTASVSLENPIAAGNTLPAVDGFVQ